MLRKRLTMSMPPRQQRRTGACRQCTIVFAVATLMVALVLTHAALLGRARDNWREGKPSAIITLTHLESTSSKKAPSSNGAAHDRAHALPSASSNSSRAARLESTFSRKAPSSDGAAHDRAHTLPSASSNSSRAANETKTDLSSTGAPSSTSIAFDKIYRHKYWTNRQEAESISGPGSTKHDTAKGRVCIAAWLAKYGIASLGDICGDFNWQHLIPGINESNYIGFDTSELALERARRKHARWRLERLDLVDRIPPKTDAFMVREVLQHLPLKMGTKLLQNVIRSGVRFLIVSTFPGSANKDIPIGQYYMNNVARAPFAALLLQAAGAQGGGGEGNVKPLETCRLYSTRKYGELWLLDVRAGLEPP